MYEENLIAFNLLLLLLFIVIIALMSLFVWFDNIMTEYYGTSLFGSKDKKNKKNKGE